MVIGEWDRKRPIIAWLCLAKFQIGAQRGYESDSRIPSVDVAMIRDD
jgi:hypothetical protein